MPSPIVTGLSPNEGPPGTTVTIRGEHLGKTSTDLIGVKICGCDCLLSAEWKTPNKIVAITGPPVKGNSEVVVTTRSGGYGTCNVTFKSYYEKIGPMKESAVWVEEAPMYSFGRNTLSPISYQHDDPLGLSTEGNEKKFPVDDLLGCYPDGSGDISGDNFSAGWFLLENHHNTSFSDLRVGLSHLRRKVESQKEGQLSFLKANVNSVMDQIDTIVALKNRFHNDTRVYGSDPTLKLEKAIKESEREARKLFDGVLARRDKAEQRQNALNVLNRFRLLFCLPCVIEQNIKKADYEVVINDYIRVKNLFNKREIAVFKVALEEIEKRMQGLQQMLQKKVVTMPISVDEQKRIIKYLITLDAGSDPAWSAITSHYDYIKKRMQQCYDEHKNVEQLQIDEMGKSKDYSSRYLKYNAFAQEENSVPENILFVEELSEIVKVLFPDLWKIGQSYFTEELHVKVALGRQVEFKKIVLAIMETYCNYLYGAIVPQQHTSNDVCAAVNGSWQVPESEVLKLWLPACLRYVRTTYTSLIKLDLPSEALDIIATLIIDLRIHCMSVLFQQTREQIKQLSNAETWRIEFTSGNTGITMFPLEFERSILEVIQIVKESVFSKEQREISLELNTKAIRELDRHMDKLLMTAHVVLSALSDKNDYDYEQNDSVHVVSQLLGTPTGSYRTNANTSQTNHQSSSNLPAWEHRLLTTLSNSQHIRLTVLPSLEAVFRRSVRSGCNAFTKCADRLEQFERAILEQYLEEKCDPLVGTIEPSMYLDRFDWDTCVPPTDVQPYAKECINNLIHVHSEVNRISPALALSVLPQVVQTISEELFRLMSCVNCRFSVFGIQQARLDISALQTCFQSYLTPKAEEFFAKAVEVLPVLDSADVLVIEDLLTKSMDRMRLQTLCLS